VLRCFGEVETEVKVLLVAVDEGHMQRTLLLPTQEQAAAQQADVRGLEADLAAAQVAGRKLAAEQAELETAQAATDQDVKVFQTYTT
jgi:hypothetical protein